MKTQGKRFRQSATSLLSSASSRKETAESQTTQVQQRPKLNQVSVSTGAGPSPTLLRRTQRNPSKKSQQRIPKLQKSSIDLQQLDKSDVPITANKSGVFERQKTVQQQNNREVSDFLSSAGLEQYYQAFLDEGFDDVQTLLQVTSDILNKLMVRASLQKRLFKLIQQKRQEIGIGNSISIQTDTQLSRSCVSSISSRNSQRLHTQSSLLSSAANLGISSKLQRNDTGRNNNNIPNSITTNASNTRPTKVKQPKRDKIEEGAFPSPLGQSVLTSRSFLFSAGDSNMWTLPGQDSSNQQNAPGPKERKACCECFKVTYNWISNGVFSYCGQNCMNKDVNNRKKKSSNAQTKKKDDDLVSLMTRTEIMTSKYRINTSINTAKKQEETELGLDDDLLSTVSLSESIVRQYR